MLQLGDYLDTVSGVKASVSSWHRVPDNAVPGPGQALRLLHQLRPGKGRGRGEGGRRGDPARPARARRGRERLQPLPRPRRCARSPRRSPATSWKGSLAARCCSSPATKGSRSKSATSTAPSSTSSTRRSSAAPASRSPRSPAIDGRPVGDGMPGPITMRLRQLFFDTVRGRHPDYAHHLTRVRARVASPAD